MTPQPHRISLNPCIAIGWCLIALIAILQIFVPIINLIIWFIIAFLFLMAMGFPTPNHCSSTILCNNVAFYILIITTVITPVILLGVAAYRTDIDQTRYAALNVLGMWIVVVIQIAFACYVASKFSDI